MRQKVVAIFLCLFVFLSVSVDVGFAKKKTNDGDDDDFQWNWNKHFKSAVVKRAGPVLKRILNRDKFVRINGWIVFMNEPRLQVGGFGEGDNQLGGADSVEVDYDGNIYVIDDIQNVIKVWSDDTSTGDVIEIISSADIEIAGLAPLGKIRAISAGTPPVDDEEYEVDDDCYEVDDDDDDCVDTKKFYILDRKKDRTPEYRILMRPSLKTTEWTQLTFTDFMEKPHDMTVDKNGRLIIVEKNGTIEVLMPDGSGRDLNFGTNGYVQLGEVDGIQVSSLKTVDTDAYGNIYVADKNNGRILKLDPYGTVTKSFGSQGNGDEDFLDQVEGVAVDWNGNVYGRDESGNRYLVFSSTGRFLTSFGVQGFDPEMQENADEFVIDKVNERFIIADNSNYRVSLHEMRYSNDHSMHIYTKYDFPEIPIVEPLWIAGGTRGNELGTEFDEPNEVAFDLNGNLWAGDIYNLRVQVFDKDGNFIAAVGGELQGQANESNGKACQFVNPLKGKKGPEAIFVDSANMVYVVDRGGKKINVYSADNLTCLGTITSPRFVDPTALVIDSTDHIYVADQAMNRIDKFKFDGTYVMTFEEIDVDGTPILDKVETFALDEGRDRLYATSENESRVEVFQLSKGAYLGKRVGKKQDGVIPQPGRFVDDVEGITADVVNDLLFMSDEDNGRIMIHDLASPDLTDKDYHFAFIAHFGTLGSDLGEFLSADGIAVSPEHDLVAVADQGNYRIQVFRISDLKSQLGFQ